MRAHFTPRGKASPEWAVSRGGRVIHQDSVEHACLVARTLGLDAAGWRAVLDRYDPAGKDLESVLSALSLAVADALPSQTISGVESGSRGPSSCPVCGGAGFPGFARPASNQSAAWVYARCTACGHLWLIDGSEPASIYTSGQYFAVRRDSGVGYDAYDNERAYREAKGRRIVQWLSAGRSPGGRLLEVGSGFGYTRKAAQDEGWITEGVDLSAYCAERARGLYGMTTHVGTLSSCLTDGRVARESFDVGLYQFVIEHVDDPALELRTLADALAPDGSVALVVPSSDAVELDLFRQRYRSLRGDHLHVFSRRSLEITLRAAGFEIVEDATICSVHLLRGFLDDAVIEGLYDRGRGPDRYVLARKVAR